MKDLTYGIATEAGTGSVSQRRSKVLSLSAASNSSVRRVLQIDRDSGSVVGVDGSARSLSLPQPDSRGTGVKAPEAVMKQALSDAFKL